MASSNLLDVIQNDLSKRYPSEIVKPLLSTYSEIKNNFFLGRYEPSELNGGKFCEVAIRLIEYANNQKFTPFGVPINMQSKIKEIEQYTNLNDSLRLHIPRVINGVYNIRNRRGVGHLGGDVNPNISDSMFIVVASDWILSELIRLHYSHTLEEAQQTVDDLIQRRFSVVYDVRDKKRVLNPKLTYREKVLLVLAATSQKEIKDSTLCDWVEHSNLSVFKRDVLKPLHKMKCIEYDPPNCIILPPGLKYVEEKYQTWIKGS